MKLKLKLAVVSWKHHGLVFANKIKPKKRKQKQKTADFEGRMVGEYQSYDGAACSFLLV